MNFDVNNTNGHSWEIVPVSNQLLANNQLTSALREISCLKGQITNLSMDKSVLQFQFNLAKI